MGPDHFRGDYGRIEIGSGTAVEENVTVSSSPCAGLSHWKKVTLGHRGIIHARSIGDWSVVGMGAVLDLRAR